MASLTLLSGTTSHVSRITNTQGQMSNGQGQIQTRHQTTSRLDNRPAYFRGVVDLGEGEPASAAGIDRNGMFHALAVRNDSTGLICYEPSTLLYVAAAALIGIGVLMLFIFIGIFMIAGGLWVGYLARRNSQARAMLSQPAGAAPFRAAA